MRVGRSGQRPDSHGVRHPAGLGQETGATGPGCTAHDEYRTALAAYRFEALTDVGQLRGPPAEGNLAVTRNHGLLRSHAFRRRRDVRLGTPMRGHRWRANVPLHRIV